MVIARNAGQRRVVGILLAAGKGARFDPSGKQSKLLQTLPNGELVAASSARTLLSALPEVLAVVRPGAKELTTILRDVGCTVVECPDADQGMGASLVYALTHARDADAWLIALADMPYVKVSTLNLLADSLTHGADIAVPLHLGRRGNPVGFSALHLLALLALGGDQGARSLIAQNPVTEIAVDDAGILRDIDTVADLV